MLSTNIDRLRIHQALASAPREVGPSIVLLYTHKVPYMVRSLEMLMALLRSELPGAKIQLCFRNLPNVFRGLHKLAWGSFHSAT